VKLLDILVPTYVQMLGALSAWLGKALVVQVCLAASMD
jgi:hypothetical protein